MTDEEDEDIIMDLVNEAVLEDMLSDFVEKTSGYTDEDWQDLEGRLATELDSLDLEDGQDDNENVESEGNNNDDDDVDQQWESGGIVQEAEGDGGEQVTDNHQMAAEVHDAYGDSPGIDREGGGRNCGSDEEDGRNDDNDDDTPATVDRGVEEAEVDPQPEVISVTVEEDSPALFAVEVQRAAEEARFDDLPDDGGRVVIASEGEEEEEERVFEAVEIEKKRILEDLRRKKEEEDRIKEEEEADKLRIGSKRRRKGPQDKKKEPKMYEMAPPPEGAPKAVKRRYQQTLNAKRNRDKQKDEMQKMRDTIEQLAMENEAAAKIIKRLSSIIAKKGLLGEVMADEPMDVGEGPSSVSVSHNSQSHNHIANTNEIAVTGIRQRT